MHETSRDEAAWMCRTLTGAQTWTSWSLTHVIWTVWRLAHEFKHKVVFLYLFYFKLISNTPGRFNLNKLSTWDAEIPETCIPPNDLKGATPLWLYVPVTLSVTQKDYEKTLDRLPRNLLEGCGMGPERTRSIMGQIRGIRFHFLFSISLKNSFNQWKHSKGAFLLVHQILSDRYRD